MKKQYMAATLTCAILATPAFAQTTSSPGAKDMTAPADTSAQSTMPTQGGTNGFLSMQSSEHRLAGDIIGATVKNADNDIGDVDDVILDSSGKVVGLVVSVGEFLGIGGKNVAIPMDAVQITHDPKGSANAQIVQVQFTKQQLEQAPPFKTLQDASREQKSATPAGGTAPLAPRQ